MMRNLVTTRDKVNKVYGIYDIAHVMFQVYQTLPGPSRFLRRHNSVCEP